MRQHKLYLKLRDNKPEDVPQAIIIKYRGDKPTKKSTGLKIYPKHWDDKKRWVKDEYLKDHPKLIAQLKELRDKMDEALVELQSGLISRDEAIKKITSKPFDEFTLLEYIDNEWTELKESQKQKYRVYASAIFSRLNEAGYAYPEVPLSCLNILEECRKISVILKKTVSGNEYFNMLDRVTRRAKLPLKEPFKDEGLKNTGIKRRRRVKKLQKPFDIQRFQTDGHNNINTHLQLQSYLWFLYSFCLQGTDGCDLVDIDENSFTKYKGRPEELNHFHPSGESIQSKGNFQGKQYLVVERKKGEGLIGALYNVFPILFIRDWLHYLIGVTHPHLQYKGKDRVRLFSFKSRDNEGKIWKKQRDNYRKYQTALFGVSTKRARDVFSDFCENKVGLNGFQIDRMLGHSAPEGSASLSTYLPTNPDTVQRDIYQMQVIEEFGAIKLLWNMYERFRNKEFNGIPFIKDTNPNIFIGLRLLEGGKGKLLSWSPDKEKRYQMLLNTITTGELENYLDEETNELKSRIRVLTPEEYPQELKDLHIERSKLSARTPEGMKMVPLTQEIIENNKRMGKELKERGYDVKFK